MSATRATGVDEGDSWAMHRRSEGNGPLVYPGAASPHYEEGEGIDGGGERIQWESEFDGGLGRR